jgi:hypothetical protein
MERFAGTSIAFMNLCYRLLPKIDIHNPLLHLVLKDVSDGSDGGLYTHD